MRVTFIQSTKNGGIDDSERAMMRACHLSGQMEADKAIDHYDALPKRIEAELDQDDWDAAACLVVFIILVVTGSFLVWWLY